MSRPLVYIDTSEIREGALSELKGAIGELAEFVEENEPRLLAYTVHFTDDGERMTVVHVHVDSESLDHHMEVAGPAFGRFADLLELESIRVYGQPSERAKEQLREKARLLGGSLTVQPAERGFSRLGAS